MRILADENIHREIVDWLRSHGNDVFWAAESARAEADHVLLVRAKNDQRVLLTSDLDFGELVVRRRQATSGIVLLRLGRLSPAARIEILARHWHLIETHAHRQFVVVGRRRIRIRPLSLGA